MLIYLITSALWKRQAECLLSQWMKKLRPGTEKSLVQVTSWEEMMAQLGGFGSVPDLCPLCLSAWSGQAGPKRVGAHQGILLPWTCVPGCPRSRLCDLGRPCPLAFFFGSFEFSIVSSVGFLCGQPIERARLLPVQALPFVRGLGLEPARMGGLGELFEILGA